ASQIANNKYGTTYYWMVCNGLQDNVLGQFGLLNQLWKPWNSPQFADTNSAAIVLLGWEDILFNGSSATVVWPAIQSVLEGTTAEALWVPPTSAPPSAACYLGMPSSSSAIFGFNGTNISISFSTDSHTTANNMVSAMAANSTVNASFV